MSLFVFLCIGVCHLYVTVCVRVSSRALCHCLCSYVQVCVISMSLSVFLCTGVISMSLSVFLCMYECVPFLICMLLSVNCIFYFQNFIIIGHFQNLYFMELLFYWWILN